MLIVLFGWLPASLKKVKRCFCPECGENTEVYSRITGYYRPVGNWNAGKTQEYLERKEYVIDPNAAPTAKRECACEETPAAAATTLADGNYLFTSPTCPNCKIACSMLDKASYPYQKVMATENVELTNALGIKQAPTLVVVSGGKAEKYAGVAAIKNLL